MVELTPDKLKSFSDEDLKKLEVNARRLKRDDVLENILRERVRRSGDAYDDELRQEIERGIKLYEELRSADTGRKYVATRTRQMRENNGDTGFISKLVMSRKYSTGFETMERYGYLDLTAERLAIRFADRFPPEVVRAAEEKLARRPTFKE
jgi:hypothetical protein